MPGRESGQFRPDTPPTISFERPESLVAMLGLVLVAAITPVVLYLGLAHMIVLIACVIVAIFFFTYPFVSLVLFYGARNVIDLFWWVDATMFGLNPLQLFSGAVSALAGMLFITELRKIERAPPFVPFLFFAALTVVAFFRSADLAMSLDELVKYLSPFFLMFLVASMSNTAEKRAMLVYTIAVTCTIAVAVSLYDLASGQMTTTVHHGYHRLMGGYKNLHNHALVMMFVAELFLFLTLNQKTAFKTVVCAAICAGAAVCMYLTYVRTAAVGFVAFAVIFLLLEKRYKMLVTAFVGVGIFAATSAAVQDRFSDFGKFVENDPMEGGRNGLGSGRWDLWTMSFSNFIRQPWGNLVLGLGLYGYNDLTNSWLEKFQPGKVGSIDPHNDYLTLLYQLGPMAVIAYLWMQWNVAQTAMNIARHTDDPWDRSLCHLMTGMTATVLVTNSVSNAFVQRTTLGWYYWGVAGLVFALQMAREDEWSKRLAPRPLRQV